MNKSQAVIHAKAGIQEDLPKGWRLVPLGKLRGSTAKSINPSDQPDEVFELYSVPSFSDGTPEVITGKEIGSSKRVVEPNTVLLSKINPRINRVWIVGPAGKHKQISSPEWVEFFPTDDVEPKYLMYFMQNYKFREHLTMNVSGVGGSLTRIRPKVAEDYEIPLAPKEQQKRIVAKIEELFSHIDAGIEALKKAKQLLKQYRQSVLKAAVTGELTKEWREANKAKLEPASKLLERILKERRQKWEEQQLEQFKAKGKMPKDDKWKAKYKEPESKVSIDAELPEGWKICVLDQLITELKNGISKKPTEETGLAIFRISAVRPMEVKKDDVRFLPKNFDASGFEIEDGDLLFTRYNGNPELVGVCGKVRGLQRETVYPDKLMRARLVNQELVSTDYLELSLNCGISKEFIRSSTKTTAGQSGIAGGDVKKCPVVMPGYKEQMQIAAIVDEKFTAIEHLDTELDQQLIKAEKNKQSVLASAFTGELN